LQSRNPPDPVRGREWPRQHHRVEDLGETEKEKRQQERGEERELTRS
jgi:hypothetical protein